VNSEGIVLNNLIGILVSYGFSKLMQRIFKRGVIQNTFLTPDRAQHFGIRNAFTDRHNLLNTVCFWMTSPQRCLFVDETCRLICVTNLITTIRLLSYISTQTSRIK